MGCVIKYKGQSILEEQFLQYINKQIAINNLFNENETLANAVYEALGFGKKIDSNISIKELEDTDISKEVDILYKGESIGKATLVKSENSDDVDYIEDWSIKGEYQNKGLGYSARQILQNKYPTLKLSSAASDKSKYLYEKVVKNQITPQQKQQALQLYSQYLDTIFPDSKVKDIVYHGGTVQDVFAKENIGKSTINSNKNDFGQPKAFYFTTSKESSRTYGNIKQIILNIKNPAILEQSLEDEGFGLKRKNTFRDVQKLDLKNKDGFILKDIFDAKFLETLSTKDLIEDVDGSKQKELNEKIENQHGNTIGVFEPEQIHILGSKQDIEGFKEFVTKDKQLPSNKQESVKKENNLLQKDEITDNKAILEKIANSNHPLKGLAKYLLKFNLNIPIKVVKLSETDVIKKIRKNKFIQKDEDITGIWDSETKTIYIDEGVLDNNELPNIIIHEILHGFTWYRLRKDDSFRRHLTKLYNYTKTKLNKDDYYALTDLDEFLVGVLSDTKFIKALSEIEPSLHKKYKNLFYEIIDIILSSLGIKKINTLYEETFSFLTNYLEDIRIDENTLSEFEAFMKQNQSIDYNVPLASAASSNSKTYEDAENMVVERIKKALTGRARFLKKTEEKAKKTKTSQDKYRRLEKDVEKITAFQSRKEYTKAINRFLLRADLDIDDYINDRGTGLIDKFESGKLKISDISSKDLANINRFVATYEGILDSVIILIDTMDLTVEEKDEMELKTSRITKKYKKVKVWREQVKVSVHKMILEEAGINASESDSLNEPMNDVSMWRLLVGPLEYASNKILRAVENLISKAKFNVVQHTDKVRQELIPLYKEMITAGFKESDFYEKDEKEQPTRYIIREFYTDKYLQELEKIQIKATEIRNKNISESNKKKDISSLYRAFYQDNTISFFNEDTYENYSEPNEKYVNKNFKKLLENPAAKKYYDKLIEIRKADAAKLPKSIRKSTISGWDDANIVVYKVPQVRKNIIEIFNNKGTGWKEYLKEKIKVVEGEDIYGSGTYKDFMGKIYKFVPIYFINDVEKNSLTTELTSSVIIFSEMAENYKQMTGITSDVELVKEILEDSVMTNGKAFGTSNSAKALDSFLDTVVYNELAEPDNLTKKVDTVNSWMRNINLVFNHITQLAGFIKGYVDTKIEDISGLYSTQESKIWAESEIWKNIPQVVKEFESNTQSNPMHRIFEKMEVFEEMKRQYRNLNANKGSKFFLSSDFWYGNYKSGSYYLFGKHALSIMDNYRLYNGKIINKDTFKMINKDLSKSEVDLQWSDLRNKGLTFYELYKNNDNKLTKEDIYKVYWTVKQRISLLEGKLTDNDRSLLSKYALGRLILTHRGWLIKGVDERLKKKNLNLKTGIYEEGYYRTVYEYIKRAFITEESKFKIGMAKGWDNLTPLEKRALLKTALDLGFLAVLFSTYLLLKGFADDEDNYTMDFLSYLSTRVLIEHSSLINPSDLYEAFKNPLPTISRVELFSDIFMGLMPFVEDKEFEKGPYEGLNHKEKALIQLIPGLRTFWEYDDPDMKRNQLESSYLSAF